MGDKPDKVTEIFYCNGVLGQAPEGSEGNLKPYPEGCTASLAPKRESNKSGYLTFDPGGFSTINWWPKRGQVSEYIRSTRVNPSSEPS